MKKLNRKDLMISSGDLQFLSCKEILESQLATLSCCMCMLSIGLLILANPSHVINAMPKMRRKQLKNRKLLLI